MHAGANFLPVHLFVLPGSHLARCEPLVLALFGSGPTDFIYHMFSVDQVFPFGRCAGWRVSMCGLHSLGCVPWNVRCEFATLLFSIYRVST